jgi:signal transduction histidine kinase
MRMLLIEDNAGDARLLEHYLGEARVDHVTVTWSNRLSTGLDRLAQRDFDLVLLDLALPDSQGMETLARVHDAANHVPIVVLTSLEDESLGIHLVQAGAQDYLAKGQLTPSLLMRALRYATERKRSDERLRHALRRLEVIREQERARIARELHDEFGVGLTCLKMDLLRLRTITGETVSAINYRRIANRIQSMVAFIDTAIHAIQRIVTDLRPTMLDELGLVAAIEWQAQEVQRRTGIVCTVESDKEELKVESERATVVFRICQEALANVARHASATAASVMVQAQEDGALVLEVTDNGCGIAPDKIDDPQSLGLLGMRERAGLFGGKVTVSGRPGHGTTVTLWLPPVAHRT